MPSIDRLVQRLRRPIQRFLWIAGAGSLACTAGLALSPRLRTHFAVALSGTGGTTAGERVRIDHAIDGDTLVTADGRTVRVIGIDAPETHHPDMDGPQPFGPEAAARMAALVDRRTVRLEADAVDVDDYGRLLRHVRVDGRLVAATLAAEGLAYVLVIPPNVAHEAALRTAEASARAARRGVWGIARPTGVTVFATPPDVAGAAAGKAAASMAGSQRPSAPLDAIPLASLATPAADGAVDPSQPCGARVAGAIPAESAGDHLDTYQAVEFEVVRTKDTGKVTFLNSHEPFQSHFYAAVFPTDYADFPAPPAEHFAGRCIVVQGRIELYRGAPQIVVRGAGDVRVVDGRRP
ncbi:MAG: thermonuclease family protein [Ardenticatenales bacterium]|nr:thermonuclease family protein [Ardenticatenales bacterium]